MHPVRLVVLLLALAALPPVAAQAQGREREKPPAGQGGNQGGQADRDRRAQPKAPEADRPREQPKPPKSREPQLKRRKP